MTTERTPSPLRQPMVINVLRDLARDCGKGEFNRRAAPLLKERFGLEPTKGQLAGVIFREGIVLQSEEMRTDGAVAVIKAQRMMVEKSRKRDRLAEQKEVLAASSPELPHMMNPQAIPWNLGSGAAKRFHPKSAVVPPAAPPPPAPIAPVPAAPAIVASLRPEELAKLPKLRPTPLAPAARPLPRAAKCQWPLGDPEPAQIMKFCDDPTHPGRSYCTAHCRKAYQGFRENRPEHEATAGYAGLFPARRL